MKKAMKIMIKILLALLILAAALVLYIRNQMGASPSKEDINSYEKLSYFKDGTFQSPVQLFYDFNNVRNGPAGFGRFASQSIFAPKQELPKILLNKESFSSKPEDFALYWLGHSAAIMDLDGKRFIFDPVLGNAAPLPYVVPRYNKSPIKRKDLPEIDYIVITHNHYDHLEKKTVQSIKQGQFIVPLGVGAALKSWGIEDNRIIELGWGESFETNGFKITAEEGVHYSNRGIYDRNKTLWNSYVIKSPTKNIFWGGDTGYSEHFARIGKKYDTFDFAAMEIDGWNTGWPNTHMFPEEVIMAAKDIDAKTLLPTHWAVFDLALHPWHESVDMLLEAADGTNIIIFTPKMGEKINLKSTTTTWWK